MLQCSNDSSWKSDGRATALLRGNFNQEKHGGARKIKRQKHDVDLDSPRMLYSFPSSCPCRPDWLRFWLLTLTRGHSMGVEPQISMSHSIMLWALPATSDGSRGCSGPWEIPLRPTERIIHFERNKNCSQRRCPSRKSAKKLSAVGPGEEEKQNTRLSDVCLRLDVCKKPALRVRDLGFARDTRTGKSGKKNDDCQTWATER